jgi:hypothetical protein
MAKESRLRHSRIIPPTRQEERDDRRTRAMQMIVGHAAQEQPEQAATAVRGIADRARQESERRMVGQKPAAAPAREPVAGLRDAA